MEWQPIETAPKDKPIIGYWSIYKRPRVMWWNYPGNMWESLSDSDEQPTHWIPLPPPPKDQP